MHDEGGDRLTVSSRSGALSSAASGRRGGGGGTRTATRRGRRAGESELHRADRNMLELLQELRVAQIGVQILFAGLISVSFMEWFQRVDAFQRWTYVVTLLLAAVTTGLLVAPAAAHRMTFGRGVKLPDRPARAPAVRVGGW